jgi:hypothetical protein
VLDRRSGEARRLFVSFMSDNTTRPAVGLADGIAQAALEAQARQLASVQQTVAAVRQIISNDYANLSEKRWMPDGINPCDRNRRPPCNCTIRRCKKCAANRRWAGCGQQRAVTQRLENVLPLPPSRRQSGCTSAAAPFSGLNMPAS